MNGYFQRLIARSSSTGSQARPLSRQPYAIPPRERSLAGSDEVLAGTTRFGAATSAERSIPSADEATETADIPTPTLHPHASAGVDTGTSVTTTARDSIEMPLRQPAPASGQSQPMGEDDGSMTRGTHTGQSAEATQPLGPGIPPQPMRQEILLPVEEFRLMQPRPVAPHSAPSAPAATIKPFFLARSPMRSPGYADLSAAEQRNNKHAGHEPSTVQVTIGRVEIRATMASPPVRKTPPRSPAMSLDEYLKQRNGSR